MEVIVPSDGCRLWFLAASPADHSWDRARRVKPTLSGAHFLIVRAVSARLSIILTGGGGGLACAVTVVNAAIAVHPIPFGVCGLCVSGGTL